MLKVFEDQLQKLLTRSEIAKSAIEKEAVLNDLDQLLLRVFSFVNESVEKNREHHFISELQDMEYRIALTKEIIEAKLFEF